MPTRSISRSILRDRRRLLTALALLLGLGEFGDAFAISFWEAAAIVSLLFLAGALWMRRGGIGGPILVGVLFAFEILSFPTYKRTGVADWATQLPFALVSAAGLLVALAVLKRAFHTRQAKKRPIREEGAST